MEQEKIRPYTIHTFLDPDVSDPQDHTKKLKDPIIVEYKDGQVGVIDFDDCPADAIWAVRRSDLTAMRLVPADLRGAKREEIERICQELRNILNGPQRDKYNCLKQRNRG